MTSELKSQVKVDFVHFMENEKFGRVLLKTKGTPSVASIDSYLMDNHITSYFNQSTNTLNYVATTLYTKVDGIKDYLVIIDSVDDFKFEFRDRPGNSARENTFFVLDIKPYEQNDIQKAILEAIKKNEESREKSKEL